MFSKEDLQNKSLQPLEEENRILLQGNEFIYLLPNSDIRDCVSNYMIAFPTEENNRYGVVPHMSAMLFIEHNIEELSLTLYGNVAKPSFVDNLSGVLIIITFQPTGLYALTGINQSDLTSETIPFEVVNSELNTTISKAIKTAKDIYELVMKLDTLFMEKMKAAYPLQLKSAIQNIIDCHGNTTVKKVADEAHYSERQLNRLFVQHIGVSIKGFLRLVRVNNAFQLLENGHDNMTGISDTLGFNSLSHFIRDFKALSGFTPQEYRNVMSDFNEKQQTVRNEDTRNLII